MVPRIVRAAGRTKKEARGVRPVTIDIAASIKHIRGLLGLTPSEMAEVLGFTIKEIDRTEIGRGTGLSQSAFEAIRETTGVDPYVRAWAMYELSRGDSLAEHASVVLDRFDAELYGRRGGIEAWKAEGRWDAKDWGGEMRRGRRKGAVS